MTTSTTTIHTAIATAAAAGPSAPGGDPTAVLWAALHGLITLSRNDRIRSGHDSDRIDLLVAQFRGEGSRHL